MIRCLISTPSKHQRVMKDTRNSKHLMVRLLACQMCWLTGQVYRGLASSEVAMRQMCKPASQILGPEYQKLSKSLASRARILNIEWNEFWLWQRNNFIWKDIQISLHWTTTISLEDLHDCAGIQSQRQEGNAFLVFFFFSGIHKEKSIIKHHTCPGQRVFFGWQANRGISNQAPLCCCCRCVAIVLMYFWLLGICLFLVSEACILFKEFWFCRKGCSYISRIMFLQQYLKNNYGLIWAILMCFWYSRE